MQNEGFSKFRRGIIKLAIGKIKTMKTEDVSFIDEEDRDTNKQESAQTPISEGPPTITEDKWSPEDWINEVDSVGGFDTNALFESLLEMHNMQADSKDIYNQVNKDICEKGDPIASSLNKAEAELDYNIIASTPFLAEKLLKRRNTFTTFCEETNLNGWYFISKENKCSRVFWGFIIFLSIALACLSTYVIISEFLAASTIKTIESAASSLDKVVFPSIIACNQNMVIL